MSSQTSRESGSTQMSDVNLPQLLTPVIDVVESAGELIKAEWARAGEQKRRGGKDEVIDEPF